MVSYYSAIILICWLALGTMSVLVYENNRLSDREKWSYYVTYCVIALAALAEWLGVQLDGMDAVQPWVLRWVKCMDYILTPLAGGVIVWQIQGRGQTLRRKILIGLLFANTLFQFVAFFQGWMVTIGPSHRYVHGPLYKAYIFLYLAVIALIIWEFLSYSANFDKRNRVSLYSIVFVVIISIVLQELGGKEVRTAYIGLTIGTALLYIHVHEFSQMRMDLQLSEQKTKIELDALTGAFSRYAYIRALKEMEGAGALPEDLIIYVIDINELKHANDTIGHDAGDELIRGAVSCISEAFGQIGTCYRTGGDEFVVFARTGEEQAEKIRLHLEQLYQTWKGEKVKELNLAIGYASSREYPELSCADLVKEADQKMYHVKAAYYQKKGKDRRGT